MLFALLLAYLLFTISFHWDFENNYHGHISEREMSNSVAVGIRSDHFTKVNAQESSGRHEALIAYPYQEPCSSTRDPRVSGWEWTLLSLMLFPDCDTVLLLGVCFSNLSGSTPVLQAWSVTVCPTLQS